MPFFEQEQLQKLVGNHADADYTLDLHNVSIAQAQAAIERLLQQHRGAAPASILIRLDPATPTSGETLFLPVGRQLLEARRQGIISRLSTLPEGAGFYLELTES